LPISFAKNDTTKSELLLDKANRHGLVTGATGTGKTVSLQRLMEGFSRSGVPVVAADVKGDLSGIAKPASDESRSQGFPVAFWDLFGENGLPIRTSVQEMGEDILGAMLGLNPTQQGALAICFRKSENERDFMLTLDDLRWSLNDMLENRAEICSKYGNITGASVSAIQRGILALEGQGGAFLFGEPPFEIADFFRVDPNGRGFVNLIHADDLMRSPKLYAMFLLWLLKRLFDVMPERGDAEKPELVFFFDEAHLLFAGAPKPLLAQIERLVRLVRSKGVGVFFVTQSAKDVPESVLGQLGNRIQHALRAFTPADRKVVKASADAFRPNEGVDVRSAITEMGTGEALVSFLDSQGIPTPVERMKVMLPASQIGPISDDERKDLIRSDDMAGDYGAERSAEIQKAEFDNRMRLQRDLPMKKVEATPEDDEAAATIFEKFIPDFEAADEENAAPPSKFDWRGAAANLAWVALFLAVIWYSWNYDPIEQLQVWVSEIVEVPANDARTVIPVTAISRVAKPTIFDHLLLGRAGVFGHHVDVQRAGFLLPATEKCGQPRSDLATLMP
jgi:hypothetical protein